MELPDAHNLVIIPANPGNAGATKFELDKLETRTPDRPITSLSGARRSARCRRANSAAASRF
jgi:hypothetical protein